MVAELFKHQKWKSAVIVKSVSVFDGSSLNSICGENLKVIGEIVLDLSHLQDFQKTLPVTFTFRSR